MKYDQLRVGQNGAIKTVIERLEKESRYTSIVLPTRYGKSDVIRLASLESRNLGIAKSHIALSPSSYLAGQLVRPDKIAEMAARYDLPHASLWGPLGQSLFRRAALGHEWRPFSNNEVMLSATQQLAIHNISRFCDIARERIDATGTALVFHIDEAHETSDVKRRGDFVQAVVEAGAYVILYTATPVRADGELIPGFEIETLDTKASEYTTIHQTDDPNALRVDYHSGVARLQRLKADFQVTFKQAWLEDPSPLCKLDRDVVTVDVTKLKIRGDDEDPLPAGPLSKMRGRDARRAIEAACVSPLVINSAIEVGAKRVREYQAAGMRDAAMIVFALSDARGRSQNEHPKRIRAACRKTGVTAVIATMADDSDDGTRAHEIITEFIAGKNDALIVKQMGGAGLDGDRIKVVVDLSTVRTPASFIQRIMRGATPRGRWNVSTVVTLDDIFTEELWDEYVVREGGQGYWVNDTEVTRSEIVEKTEQPKEEVMSISGATVEYGSDHMGRNIDDKYARQVEFLVQCQPVLALVLTKPELAQALKELANNHDSVLATPALCALSIEDLRRDISDRVGSWLKLSVRYVPGTPGYSLASKAVWKRLKLQAGVPVDTKLKTITDYEILLRLRDLASRLGVNTHDEAANYRG